MNRVLDYMGFALWFLGLGYMALWPLTAHDALYLSPGLHLVGMLASVWVLAGLALWPIRRSRRSLAAVNKRASSGTLKPRSARPPPPPRRYVKPRSHFGLRGMPR